MTKAKFRRERDAFLSAKGPLIATADTSYPMCPVTLPIHYA